MTARTTTNTVRTWEYAVPSVGTYTVAIMCGDADSRAQTNHLVVEGTPVRDATPYDGNVLNGYETGSFDGYVLTVTVNDGKLTLIAAADSLAPKLNFIEISGPNPAALDQATIDLVTAAGVQATQDTARPKAKRPPLIKRSIWSGGYVDDLASYTVKKPRRAAVRYFAHANHLFSTSAVTNRTGQVVERYSYYEYGVRTVKNPTNVVIAKSGVGCDRGFTGYKIDGETGLYAARARMYSAKIGHFIGRDPHAIWKFSGVYIPWSLDGYQDGYSLYADYFVPGMLDPSGMYCVDECSPVGIFQSDSGMNWDWIPSLNGSGHNDPDTIPGMVTTVDNANTALVATGGIIAGAGTGSAVLAAVASRVGSNGTGVATGLVDPAVDRYTPPLLRICQIK